MFAFLCILISSAVSGVLGYRIGVRHIETKLRAERSVRGYKAADTRRANRRTATPELPLVDVGGSAEP